MMKQELLGEARIEGKSAIQFSLPVAPKREVEFLAVEVVTVKVGFKSSFFSRCGAPFVLPTSLITTILPSIDALTGGLNVLSAPHRRQRVA